MSEFSIRSDNVDVKRIMEQVRARIKEKRGEDYTEEQIRELANVQLERFLDPGKVRSDLVEHYRRRRVEAKKPPLPPPPDSFDFDPDIIYRSSRGVVGRLLYGVRKLLSPLLKLVFNVQPIVHALHVQREINLKQAEFIDTISRLFDVSGSRLSAREEIDALNYEIMNNLVVEMTRLSIEMKNHRMRVESVAGRLDFNERRARALEGAVQYRDDARAPGEAKAGDGQSEGGESKRRRRRRGRRRPSRTAAGGGEANDPASATPADDAPNGTASAEWSDTPAGGPAPPPADSEPPPDANAPEPAPPAATAAPSPPESPAAAPGSPASDPEPPPAAPEPPSGEPDPPDR